MFLNNNEKLAVMGFGAVNFLFTLADAPSILKSLTQTVTQLTFCGV